MQTLKKASYKAFSEGRTTVEPRLSEPYGRHTISSDQRDVSDV